MAGKNDKPSINTVLNDFIQNHRKTIIAGLASLVGAIIVLVVVFTVRENLQARALSQLDEFYRSYNSIMSYTGDAADDQQYYLYSLLDELSQFQKKNSGYAAARAYGISAAIYADQGDWYSAEEAWLSAALAAKKTYYAPVAYFNAAAVAEERNEIARAIELYTTALEFGDIFPAAPRAQFSIGRLHETQGSIFDALFAYQNLINNWPQDQVWVNLAQSRILFLTAIMER